MLLYMMRHGQTCWNVEKRMQGRSDIPLSEEGRALTRQAAERMRHLPFDLILTSPLSRARETAQIVADGRGIPVCVEPALVEMGFGICEGHTRAECPEIITFFNDPEHFSCPGAERYQEVDERCRDLLERLKALEGTHEHILLCSHGALIKGLLRVVHHRSLAEFWVDPPQPNCSVNVIELCHGEYRLLEYGKVY